MARLGDMSPTELIKSADNEFVGFVNFVRNEFDLDFEQNRWINAYEGSVRARLAVAEMKAEAISQEEIDDLIEMRT